MPRKKSACNFHLLQVEAYLLLARMIGSCFVVVGGVKEVDESMVPEYRIMHQGSKEVETVTASKAHKLVWSPSER
eukprot:1767645-Amphidinium_carterae.1